MLTKEQILKALQMISDALKAKEVEGNICICGGSALLLAFDARPSTKDIDSVYAPTDEFRKITYNISEELGLPKDWLNDGVKGYLTKDFAQTKDGMPQFSNLSVTRPETDYLFYMKCMASRISEGSHDLEDIKFLGKKLNIKSSHEALDIINKHHPREIPVKVQYVLENIFDVAEGD